MLIAAFSRTPFTGTPSERSRESPGAQNQECLGRYSLCRELIQEIQDAGLVDYLPKESITDNGRFSPSGRYQEIYDALY